MFKNLFSRKSKRVSDKSILEYYQTDLHSHLIPGIDDGSQSMSESIEIIKSLKDLGFKKIITTPHIMAHRFPNTKESIKEGLKKLKKELENQDIDIKIKAAAEYYYDENFFELIDKDDLLTFGDNYVLFELSYTHKPFGIEQTIFNLLSKGYKPVLAHPERYSYYHENLEKFEKLKNTGLRFQLNLNSLVGFYGKKPQKTAQYLVDNGFIDFIGSDTHAMNYVDSFKEAIYTKVAHEIFKKNRIKNYAL